MKYAVSLHLISNPPPERGEDNLLSGLTFS